jgi:hypothetical protein
MYPICFRSIPHVETFFGLLVGHPLTHKTPTYSVNRVNCCVSEKPSRNSHWIIVEVSTSGKTFTFKAEIVHSNASHLLEFTGYDEDTHHHVPQYRFYCPQTGESFPVNEIVQTVLQVRANILQQHQHKMRELIRGLGSSQSSLSHAFAAAAPLGERRVLHTTLSYLNPLTQPAWYYQIVVSGSKKVD